MVVAVISSMLSRSVREQILESIGRGSTEAAGEPSK
jgi:hypothetical protein